KPGRRRRYSSSIADAGRRRQSSSLQGEDARRRPVAGAVAIDAILAIREDASSRGRTESCRVARNRRVEQTNRGARLRVDSGARIAECGTVVDVQDRIAVREEAVDVRRRQRVVDDALYAAGERDAGVPVAVHLDAVEIHLQCARPSRKGQNAGLGVVADDGVLDGEAAGGALIENAALAPAVDLAVVDANVAPREDLDAIQ